MNNLTLQLHINSRENRPTISIQLASVVFVPLLQFDVWVKNATVMSAAFYTKLDIFQLSRKKVASAQCSAENRC